MLLFLYVKYVTNTGAKFVFKTNRNAPNSRIVEIDLERPGEENWVTLIPVSICLVDIICDQKEIQTRLHQIFQESPNEVLMQAICVDNDKILTDYARDVKVKKTVNYNKCFIPTIYSNSA